MITIKNSFLNTWNMILTAKSPISHHDPDQSGGNRNLFRRQSIAISQTNSPPGQDDISAMTKSLPVPEDIAEILQQSTYDQFFASAILKAFIDRYNSKDGAGLFSGAERYTYLEQRFQNAAVSSLSLLEMWGRACKNLMVDYREGADESILLALLSCSPLIQQNILKVLSSSPRPCIMLARLWHESQKLQSKSYAEVAGTAPANKKTEIMHFETNPNGDGITVIDIPVVSANTLRHQMVREPSMWHLYDRLALGMDDVLPTINAMFYNGGDIKAGAKAPKNTFWARKEIRDTFPSIELLSGSTDSFIIGEGELSVHSWIICKENNSALSAFGIDSGTSIFDLIDDWTLTRHSGRTESGQMPFGFETLVQASQIFVSMRLSPYASDLCKGALMAALQTYKNTKPSVGGGNARGFSLVDLSMHECEMDRNSLDQYETYLKENSEMLKDYLISGTLGNGRKTVTM